MESEVSDRQRIRIRQAVHAETNAKRARKATVGEYNNRMSQIFAMIVLLDGDGNEGCGMSRRHYYHIRRLSHQFRQRLAQCQLSTSPSLPVVWITRVCQSLRVALAPAPCADVSTTVATDATRCSSSAYATATSPSASRGCSFATSQPELLRPKRAWRIEQYVIFRRVERLLFERRQMASSKMNLP